MTDSHRRREPRRPCVYLLASRRSGTLYLGVTSNLPQRVWQNRQGYGDGFASRYGICSLVWYEQHETMLSAIAREKALKAWQREWKVRLIEESNPEWRDLYDEIG